MRVGSTGPEMPGLGSPYGGQTWVSVELEGVLARATKEDSTGMYHRPWVGGESSSMHMGNRTGSIVDGVHVWACGGGIGNYVEGRDGAVEI